MGWNTAPQPATTVDVLEHWAARAQALLSRLREIDQAEVAAVKVLKRRILAIPDAAPGWMVLPLRTGDEHVLEGIALRGQLPPLNPAELRAISELASEVPNALQYIKMVYGRNSVFAGHPQQQRAAVLLGYLDKWREYGHFIGVSDLMARFESVLWHAIDRPLLKDALYGPARLADRLGISQCHPMHLDIAAVSDLGQASWIIRNTLQIPAETHEEGVLLAGERVKDESVRSVMAQLPLVRLRDATRERLIVRPLEDAGINTVQALLDAGSAIARLPGIGPVMARRMLGAAHALRQTLSEESPVRIDIGAPRSNTTTELLRALWRWDVARRARITTDDITAMERFAALVPTLREPTVKHLIVWGAGSKASDFMPEIRSLVDRAGALSISQRAAEEGDPWEDFLARPADYFALLEEVGLAKADEGKAHGDLPAEIVEAVRAQELDTSHLRVGLRGYQGFGARFALVQRKAIIGDEMGLGKTVEALAMLAHLRAKGSHHALVVCPASVVTNWVREVRSKSELLAFRLHGQGREIEARTWLRSGGVGVTTFDSLGWFETYLDQLSDLGALVVDEAHYIKNPDAQRTMRTIELIRRTDRAILLTGTPMENRLDEFVRLVSYLRPDLVVEAQEVSAVRFRRQVAPAYLRRNQEDVLTELPELVETDDWLTMSASDMRAYRAAVSEGNFAKMRYAAMVSGAKSAKVERLLEVVEEAEENGRRVVVFSHFRTVLEELADHIPGQVFGPLTGSTPAPKRQSLVDSFSAARHGAVLLSQIVAGGVGLNIQAASVVVICEPQLKPTTEWQAIARAHRMGQLHSVQVHRLLSEDSVDQRVVEILAHKKELFDEFARVSDTAHAAPEAFDVTESELARQIMAEERRRLLGGLTTLPAEEQDA